jgi:PII interaction protein X
MIKHARLRAMNSPFRGSVFDYNPGTLIALRTTRHPSMSAETYLNHPTFGLLHRLCQLDPRRELFTTLYAQRLFFLVEHQVEGLKIESLGRNDAKVMLEQQMRAYRSQGQTDPYTTLHKVHQKVFC